MDTNLNLMIFLTIAFVFFVIYERSNLSSVKTDLLNFKKTAKGFFYLSDSSLSCQPIFWFGVLIPLFIAGYLEFKILSNSQLIINFSNLDKVYSLSSIPIYITALTPTLGIFIANIHRTIQTKKQIDNSLLQINISNRQYETALNQYTLAEKKNLADSYYSHYKYINDEFKNIILIEKVDSTLNALKNRNIIVNRPHFLYKKIFNKSNISMGYNVEVSSDFISGLIRVINAFIKNVEINNVDFSTSIINDAGKVIVNKVSKINTSSNNILAFLGSTCNNNNYIRVNYREDEDKKVINVNDSLYEIAWGVRKIYDFIMSILDIIGFDKTKNKELDNVLKQLSNIIIVLTNARKIYSEVQNKK